MDVQLTTQVQAARAGGQEAWDTLLRSYQLPLFTYVCNLVGERQGSLDLVQDTFLNAVRHIGSLRDDAKFGPWLFGIARQNCIRHWRRAGYENVIFDRTDEPSADPPAPDRDDPAAWLVRRECEEAFATALAGLPAAHREVVVLHCLEEFPLDEIAEIAAVPVGTVKSRLHHARLKLRALMEDHL